MSNRRAATLAMAGVMGVCLLVAAAFARHRPPRPPVARAQRAHMAPPEEPPALPAAPLVPESPVVRNQPTDIPPAHSNEEGEEDRLLQEIRRRLERGPEEVRVVTELRVIDFDQAQRGGR